MVLLYRVDVKALAPEHRASVLELANASGTEALWKLDTFWYGVLYQDRSRVLGVALVVERGGVHAIERICVFESERSRGIGTELLGIVKDQLAPGAAACCTVPEHHPRREALASFLESSGFAASPDGTHEFMKAPRNAPY